MQRSRGMRSGCRIVPNDHEQDGATGVTVRHRSGKRQKNYETEETSVNRGFECGVNANRCCSKTKDNTPRNAGEYDRTARNDSRTPGAVDGQE